MKPDGRMKQDSAPMLFGRRLRRWRTLASGVVQWSRRYDGLEVIVTHDPNLQGSSRWYWQIDAWKRHGALTGGARTQRAALRQCEVVLARLARALKEEPHVRRLRA